jgi:hypothetical protein
MLQLPPDFFVDPIGYISFYWGTIGGYVIFIVQMLILLAIYMFVVRIIKRSLQAIHMGTEAASGITLVLRLFFFIVALTITVNALDPDIATLLSLTAIFGTAIGLAFSQALSNIVSGFYVIIARPFRIGDYVRVGDIEGIVREITLNYTRILLPDETRQFVPNSKIVSSAVTNFRISVSDYIQEKEEESEKKGLDRNYRKVLRDVLVGLRKLARDEEAYRYTFDLTYHMNYDHGELRKRFDKVCEQWGSIFITKPTYMVWAAPNAGLTYRFAIIVSDPITIIKRVSEFMRDLTAIYDIP